MIEYIINHLFPLQYKYAVPRCINNTASCRVAGHEHGILILRYCPRSIWRYRYPSFILKFFNAARTGQSLILFKGSAMVEVRIKHLSS